MTTLVVGATGATGKLLVKQLLIMGQKVKLIIRPTAKIPDTWKNNNKVSIIKANIAEVSVDEMVHYLTDCQSVASCLGHNITFKGVFGKPRKLVTNAVELICTAIMINSHEKPIKFVLMNTTGNRNRDLNEPISFGEKLLMGLIRLLLPPQPDNEQAAEYLRTNIGHNDATIEWTAVRPSSLIDEEQTSEFEIFPSPVRSILDDGQISRINVGHFMADLITNNELWNSWKGQMPVVYNEGF